MALSTLYEIKFKLVSMRQDATGKERDELNKKIAEVQKIIDRAEAGK